MSRDLWRPGTVERGEVQRMVDAGLEALRVRLSKLEAALGGYRLVVGTVNSDGSVNTSGPNTGGWSSSRSGVGAYGLTFAPAFVRVPALLLTGWTTSEIRHLALSASSASITCFNSAGAAIDSAFDFVAIGNR